jgi:hypothetical protein
MLAGSVAHAIVSPVITSAKHSQELAISMLQKGPCCRLSAQLGVVQRKLMAESLDTHAFQISRLSPCTCFVASHTLQIRWSRGSADGH